VGARSAPSRVAVQDVKRTLLSAEPARSASGRVTVQGLGGMGKTELALAYAHAFAWDYPGGRWQVACEHTGDLRLALTRLAGPIRFEFTEEEKKDLTRQFDRVLELTRREQRHHKTRVRVSPHPRESSTTLAKPSAISATPSAAALAPSRPKNSSRNSTPPKPCGKSSPATPCRHCSFWLQVSGFSAGTWNLKLESERRD